MRDVTRACYWIKQSSQRGNSNAELIFQERFGGECIETNYNSPVSQNIVDKMQLFPLVDSKFDLTKGRLERARYEIKVRKINTLFARKDFDKALNVAHKLLRKYPKQPNLYNTVGEIHLSLNQIDHAIRR